MDIVSEAMHFAIDAFAGKTRKGDGNPLILHSVEAASIAASLTNDREVIAAAVLHDTAEDAGIALSTIEEKFGKKTARLVAAETENKRKDMPACKSWKIRKEEAIELLKSTNDPDVKIVFLADKLSNMRSFYTLKKKLGDGMFDNFNQKDPAEQHWYYRTIANELSEFSDTLAFMEYDNLIALVFDENKDIK